MSTASVRVPTVARRLPGAVAARATATPRASIPVAAFAVFTVLYSVIGVRDQLLGRTGSFDLGIFVQEVRGYADWTGPISAIKGPGFNLLGDHFSPITALIAPFYALFPSALTVLVAQAVLIAASIVPLAWYARRELGAGAAIVVAIAYGSSFGVASAVGFDFHEVAFAAPLLAMSCVAIADRRWRSAALWAVPLVLVKEDLGVTVAAIGALIAWQGPRRLGLGLAAFGIAATAIEMLVIIPAFNPSDSYAYSGQLTGGSSSLHTLLSDPQVKAMTVLLTLAVTGFAALRSPIVLIAVPTFAWRFVNAKTAYWGTGYHYDLLPMVIVFAAMVHSLAGGLGARAPILPLRWTLGVVLGTAVLLVPSYSLGTLLSPSAWTPDARASVLSHAEALVPDGATVAASGYVGPQLVDRATVSYLWGPDALQAEPAWIVADLREPGPWVPVGPANSAVLKSAEQSGWTRVFDERGVVVLHRD